MQATNLHELRAALAEADIRNHTKIIVRFHGDCHVYSAQIEQVDGQRWLVVPGIAVICSAAAVIDDDLGRS
jgi:precorrin-4 methylase